MEGARIESEQIAAIAANQSSGIKNTNVDVSLAWRRPMLRCRDGTGPMESGHGRALLWLTPAPACKTGKGGRKHRCRKSHDALSQSSDFPTSHSPHQTLHFPPPNLPPLHHDHLRATSQHRHHHKKHQLSRLPRAFSPEQSPVRQDVRQVNCRRCPSRQLRRCADQSHL
jgi:hypothetical protein